MNLTHADHRYLERAPAYDDGYFISIGSPTYDDHMVVLRTGYPSAPWQLDEDCHIHSHITPRELVMRPPRPYMAHNAGFIRCHLQIIQVMVGEIQLQELYDKLITYSTT